MKVLVVDDEKVLVKGIKFNLENDGYTVDTAYDGEEALRKVREGGIDLVVLDLMLPKMDGLKVCQKIREFSTVPVLMLTAKTDDTDIILGFEFGADDYITKPFNIMELKARLRAILRRSMKEVKDESALCAGNIRLEYNTRNVYVDGRLVELTTKEFDLLEILMKNMGHVYSREKLLNVVWGYEYPGDVRTVDVHIRRIREKVERMPAEPEHIMTKWGVGYYFKNQ